MSSLCSLGLAPQWMHKSANFFFIFKFKRRTLTFVPRVTSSSSSSNDDDSVSAPKSKQVGYDLSEELFGLEVNLKPRNASLGARKPRSWFGPNGQYMRELPCPSCRGRGYTPCAECGIERSRSDCSQCMGNGIMTCRRCSGECVIWEEAIDERPWEKAHSISPLRVKEDDEDDEVDNLEIKLNVKRKSKRVYQSPPPEVGLKISRSLKSLNAKTGLFSKRMKIIHRDPRLHAQRVAAIKKAKGTAAARKHTSETLKAFFSDPENRRRRSISMQGVKFYCRHCGREGHRRHYCPELKASLMNRQFICGVCGEKGHNRRICPSLRRPKSTVRRHHHCRICDQRGHNRTTCPKLIGPMFVDVKKGLHSSGRRRTYKCKLCKENGHNSRTCPSHNRNVNPSNIGHQSRKAMKYSSFLPEQKIQHQLQENFRADYYPYILFKHAQRKSLN